MQQGSPQQSFVIHLDHFVQASKKSTPASEVEKLSQELTAYTKQMWFFPLAHKLLTTTGSLGQDKRDKEVLLTSLVKDKFKFEFQAFAAEDIEKHYRQLCEIGHSLMNSSYGAYTNVALALAYTYLHLLAIQPSSLDVFLSPFIPNSPEQARLYNIYFKTLEYIAEEIDSSRFVMDELQRQTARQRLIVQQLTVLQGLDLRGSQAFELNEINKQNILFCFEAWISLHYEANIFNNIRNHSLFHKVLEHIRDEDCSEGASQCLRSIIMQLKDPNENALIYQTLSNCTIEILALVDLSHKNLDLQKAQDFMRIIADFSRKSTPLFISGYDRNIEAYLKRLIQYLADDLMNTYQTLADFFQGFLLEIKNTPNANPALLQLLDPLYLALCYKCQFPSRIIKELNQTDESKAEHISTSAEQLFRNRQYTEDIFMAMGQLQGKAPYVQSVVAKIQALQPNDEKKFWPGVEVHLFSIIDATREYPAFDTSIATIMQMYLELSSVHQANFPICVRRTYLRVFRAILSSLQENELVYRIMCAAVSCFDQPLLISVAQKAFCRACQVTKANVQIFTHFSPALEKYTRYQFIVRGLTTIMCKESSLMESYLLQVLTFLFQKYQDETDKDLKKDYMHSFLAALKAFKESKLYKQHLNILLTFTKQSWPIIRQVLGVPLRIKDDEDSQVERMVRIVKVIMRTLEFSFSEFLQELFTIVLAAFEKYPICSYVYLVEVTVTVYSKDPSYNEYLRIIFSNFCDIAFRHMQTIENISKFSYLLDDFMGMNKRFFLHNASVLLSSGKLPSIIQLCIEHFMSCDTPRVAKAAYSFFETIFLVYWGPDFLASRNSQEDIVKFIPSPADAGNYLALKSFLVPKLQQIIGKMLHQLSSTPTQQTRDYILDALLSQVKAFFEENPVVWSKLLLKVPADVLVQKEKERLVELLRSLQGLPYDQAKKTVKMIDRMLLLMNRRMLNADNRKTINF